MTPSVIFDHQKAALLRLVAALFAVVGMRSEAAEGPGFLTRYMRLKVLAVLRPAESATRRLVVVLKLMRAGQVQAALSRAARGLPAGGIPRGTGERTPCFRLIDPRKQFAEMNAHRCPRPRVSIHEPRIIGFGWNDDRSAYPGLSEAVETPAISSDDPLDATQICRRLRALKAALEDLPKQAKRLARAEAREAARPKNVPGGPFRRVRLAPMRPGLPPGYRQRQAHPVDRVLHECHVLALRWMAVPDTS